jgi:hypothetical protein
MNLKSHALPTVGVMLLSVMTVTTVGVSAAPTAAIIALSSSSNSDSYGFSGGTNLDIMRNFQLGNYSYEIARVSQYFNRDPVCYGHKAKHAEQIMDDIERVCGALVEMSYPARKPARMLLRESNYFDCGRDQLRVDLIDKIDLGQQCVVQFINANKKEWVNGAEGNGRSGKALLCLTVAISVLALLW